MAYLKNTICWTHKVAQIENPQPRYVPNSQQKKKKHRRDIYNGSMSPKNSKLNIDHLETYIARKIQGPCFHRLSLTVNFFIFHHHSAAHHHHDSDFVFFPPLVSSPSGGVSYCAGISLCKLSKTIESDMHNTYIPLLYGNFCRYDIYSWVMLACDPASVEFVGELSERSSFSQQMTSAP